MNIYEAAKILPVVEGSLALDGRTTGTEALLVWFPDNHPEIVTLGSLREDFNYGAEILPLLKTVRANPRVSVPKRYAHDDGYFRFGGHVFATQEMEALDTWIQYYAGPSVLST